MCSDQLAPSCRGVPADLLTRPPGLVVEFGNLYLSDFLTGPILQITARGFRLQPAKPIAKGLCGPEAMAFTGDGRLLVVEAEADRLSIIDLASGELSILIPGLSRMHRPSGSRRYSTRVACVNPPGIVYLLDGDANVLCPMPLPMK